VAYKSSTFYGDRNASMTNGRLWSYAIVHPVPGQALLLENFGRCHHPTHRPVENGGARQGLAPLGARPIDSDQIPQSSASPAAIRLGLANTGLRHELRQKVLVIPELFDPVI
jgi:hypothetical protein